jgi:hypothetical protein
VEANEQCVPDIYQKWGARGCARFVVSVPSDGWLHAFLRWDSSAPGFDLKQAGEVVLVAPTGRFAASDLEREEVELSALVEPGIYDVLVMSYTSGVRLPFQLRAELQ